MEEASKLQADEILAACLANETSGWERLYRQFYPLARWVASYPNGRFHLPDDVSENIAQDVMIGLCAAIRAGKIKKNLVSYVRGIAENKCLDYIRDKTRKENNVNLNYWVGEPETSSAKDVYFEYAENDCVAVLMRCLKNIGEPCATLLELRYFAEKSYEEMALAAAIPVKHTGVRLNRCKKTLKKMVEEAHPAFWDDFLKLPD